MKKVLALLISFSIFTMQPVHAASFSDVHPDSMLSTYLDFLSAKNIIHGYPDGSFGPENSINRAESLKVIFSTVGKTTETNLNQPPSFPDVSSDAWYAAYISSALNKKIIQGYSDGSFKPEQFVNRAEFVKMAMAALPFYSSINASAEEAMDQYQDLHPGQWYLPYMAAGVRLNLLPQTKSFHPTQLMLRGEAAEIIYHMAKYLEKHPESLEKEAPFTPPESIIDISQITNPFPYNEPSSYMTDGSFISNHSQGYTIDYGVPNSIIDANFQHGFLSIELSTGCFVDISQNENYDDPEAYFEEQLYNPFDDFPSATSSVLESIDNTQQHYHVITSWYDESEPSTDHFLWDDTSSSAFRFHAHGPGKTEAECDAEEIQAMNHFSKPSHNSSP